jgi:hypothetical protein
MCHYGWPDALFPISIHLTWWEVIWTFSILNWSLANHEKLTAFKGLHYNHSIIKKGFLKHSESLKLFCQGWQNLMHIPFLKSAILLCYTECSKTKLAQKFTVTASHHTNSQQMRTAVLTPMQTYCIWYCIWLPLNTASLETLGLHFTKAISLN